MTLSKISMNIECNFFPSDEICMDESMSRWYGQVGHWINHGLPMYVAIYRKPENGCEIQNAACGHSGVIIQLKIVKTADQHNRHHQDNLKPEKKLETKKWDMRVNLTIFSMIVVDTWLVYSQETGSTELQSEFYVCLAEELIDNNIDSQPQRRRNSGEDGSDSNDESPVMTCTGRVCAGITCHLTPTKRRRRTGDGELTAQRLQGHCIECGKKTTYLCSACMDNDDESKTPWLCRTKK